MRLVVADTSPLNYLVLIEQIEILPALFKKVFLPLAVKEELSHADAPAAVRHWIAQSPTWVEIVSSKAEVTGVAPSGLDDGEREAIALALEIDADLLLMDERHGVVAARNLGFAVTGTLGILDLAARRRLIGLKDVVERLKATNFRCRPDVLNALLARHSSEELE